MPPSIESLLSRTPSIDTQLSTQFDEQVAGYRKHLSDIRDPWSLEQVERSLDSLFIQLSVEDNDLSQKGREFLKSILVEDGALEDLLRALKYKQFNPKFYRRICGCLTYLVRDNVERLTRLIDIGGIPSITELIQRFPTNEPLLWYCFDILGMLVNDGRYCDQVLNKAIDDVVQAMMGLRIVSSKLYKKAYPALVSSLGRTDRLRDQISHYIAKKSHVMLHASHNSPESAQASIQQNMQALLVCHDLLDSLVSK